MFKALYHQMGVEGSGSFQHWDTKFLSLPLDLDHIFFQTPVFATYSPLCNSLAFYITYRKVLCCYVTF